LVLYEACLMQCVVQLMCGNEKAENNIVKHSWSYHMTFIYDFREASNEKARTEKAKNYSVLMFAHGSFRRGCWKQALYTSINCTREACTCMNSIKAKWCVRSMHMLLRVGISWSMLIGTWNDVWDHGSVYQ